MVIRNLQVAVFSGWWIDSRLSDYLQKVKRKLQVWEGDAGRLQADMGLPLPTSLLHVSATHCTMKARYPSASGVLRASSLHVHLHMYCHLKGARGSQWKVRSR